MFGGVGKTGEIIHQLCHAAFHADETMGAPSARNLLINHPFLVKHVAPTGRARDLDSDQFWFSGALSGFWFLMPSDRLSVQFHGSDPSFRGFTGIATGKGRYIVTLTTPLSGRLGANAKPLAQWFVRKFDAADTSSSSAR